MSSKIIRGIETMPPSISFTFWQDGVNIITVNEPNELHAMLVLAHQMSLSSPGNWKAFSCMLDAQVGCLMDRKDAEKAKPAVYFNGEHWLFKREGASGTYTTNRHFSEFYESFSNLEELTLEGYFNFRITYDGVEDTPYEEWATHYSQFFDDGLHTYVKDAQNWVTLYVHAGSGTYCMQRMVDGLMMFN